MNRFDVYVTETVTNCYEVIAATEEEAVAAYQRSDYLDVETVDWHGDAVTSVRDLGPVQVMKVGLADPEDGEA